MWHFSDIYTKNNSTDFLEDIMDRATLTFTKYCQINTHIIDLLEQRGHIDVNFLTATESLTTLEHSFCSQLKVYMTMIFTYFQSEMRVVLEKLETQFSEFNTSLQIHISSINSLLHLCFSNDDTKEKSHNREIPSTNIYLSNFMNYVESDKIFISRISEDSSENHSMQNLQIDISFLATHPG